MSRERFAWLEDWVTDPADVIATPGTESNVKEIYDKCAELSRDPANVIFNQFSEFGNHLGALPSAPGRPWATSSSDPAASDPGLRLAGLRLRLGLGRDARRRRPPEGRPTAPASWPSRPSSARRCSTTASASTTSRASATSTSRSSTTSTTPTSSTAVSDRATDHLAVLFSSPDGRAYLARPPPRRRPRRSRPSSSFGLSSICNILAAVKTAKYLGLGPDDVVVTVATDGAEMYGSERAKYRGPGLPRRLR